MLVVMRDHASQETIDHVVDLLHEAGAEAHLSQGEVKTIIGVIGEREVIYTLELEGLPGVEEVIRVLKPYKLVSREFQPEDTVVRVGRRTVGGGAFAVIAGPVLDRVRGADDGRRARRCEAAGATMLRGGAYKPRTSPYAFQGMGLEGLKLLRAAGDEVGLPVVTEVLDVRDAETVAEWADVLQVGARNMQNFMMLEELGTHAEAGPAQAGPLGDDRGDCSRPPSTCSRAATATSSCASAASARSRRTRATRSTSPPSRRSRRSRTCRSSSTRRTRPGGATSSSPMSRAAVAAGADGVMVEVHPDPEHARCDGPQSLTPADFAELMARIDPLDGARGQAAGSGVMAAAGVRKRRGRRRRPHRRVARGRAASGSPTRRTWSGSTWTRRRCKCAIEHGIVDDGSLPRGLGAQTWLSAGGVDLVVLATPARAGRRVARTCSATGYDGRRDRRRLDEGRRAASGARRAAGSVAVRRRTSDGRQRAQRASRPRAPTCSTARTGCSRPRRHRSRRLQRGSRARHRARRARHLGRRRSTRRGGRDREPRAARRRGGARRPRGRARRRARRAAAAGGRRLQGHDAHRRGQRRTCGRASAWTTPTRSPRGSAELRGRARRVRGAACAARDVEAIRAWLERAADVRRSLPAQWVPATDAALGARRPDARPARRQVAEITAAATRAGCNIEDIDIDHQTEDRAVLRARADRRGRLRRARRRPCSAGATSPRLQPLEDAGDASMSTRGVRAELRSARRARCTVPGDKSLSHRAVLFAAMAEGTTTLAGVLDSADVRSTIGAVAALGAHVELERAAGRLARRDRCTGWGARGRARTARRIDCGNSGTTARLLMGVLAGWPDRGHADRRRVALPTPDAARDRAARAHGRDASRRPDAGTLPVTVHGTAALQRDRLRLAGRIGAGQDRGPARGPARPGPHARHRAGRQPRPHRAHAARVRRAGRARRSCARRVGRGPGRALRDRRASPCRATRRRRRSSSRRRCSCPGSEVRLPGVSLNPTRVGFLRVLERMGARCRSCPFPEAESERSGEIDVAVHAAPRGDDRVRRGGPVARRRGPDARARRLAGARGDALRGRRRAAGQGVRPAGRDRRGARRARGDGRGRRRHARGARARAASRGRARLARRPSARDDVGGRRAAWRDRPVEVGRFEAVDVSYPGFVRDLERLGLQR